MYLVITNNSELFKNVKAGFFIEGSALDVLIETRTRIHLGSILLTSPLCGNLRPEHQPFRTIIIDKHEGLPDLASLSLIEEAVKIYQSCANKIIKPENLDDYVREDYAFIDCELMRVSLEQYGLIDTKIQFQTAALRTKNSKGGI